MPDTSHFEEAARILAQMDASLPEGETRVRAQRTLAEALERAERRAREELGRRKESSG